MRPARFAKGTPAAANSARTLATSEAMPTPRITRPSETWSRVAHLVREHDGVTQRREQDGGAERDAPGARGDAGQQGDRLVARPREQRIADPHRIVAQGFGALGQRQQRRRPRPALHDALARRQQVSYARADGVLPVVDQRGLAGPPNSDEKPIVMNSPRAA